MSAQNLPLSSTFKPQIIQAFTAIASLSLALLVYLIHRPPESVYFLPNGLGADGPYHPLFGQIGYLLPSFLHVYAFILLTTACLGYGRMLTPVICGIWFLIETLFELSQHPIIAQRIHDHIPLWFEGIPFLENTSSYFRSGTFDLLDIASIIMGVMTAYLTIVLTNQGSIRHASQK